MTQDKWTPGPWEICNDGETIRCAVTGYIIADALPGWVSPSQYAANARLIAAAPELLDGVRELRYLINLVCRQHGLALPEASAATMARTAGLLARIAGE